MSNHVRLMAAAKENNLGDILRDFKKFTSKQILTAIQNNDKESRKEWMLSIFKQQGEMNSRNSEYQFWRQDNHPKECYSPQFSVQKLNYIHNNPVEAGIVEKQKIIYTAAQALITNIRTMDYWKLSFCNPHLIHRRHLGALNINKNVNCCQTY